METVQFQIFMFSITFYGGLLIGVLYDVYKAISGTRKTKGFITSFWDLLFLILSFFTMVYILFSSNFGELRAYVFIGFIVGFFIYEKIFGKVFEDILVRCVLIIEKTIKRISLWLVLPLKFLRGILLSPLTRTWKYLKKKLNIVRNFRLQKKKSLKVFEKYYKLLTNRLKE